MKSKIYLLVPVMIGIVVLALALYIANREPALAAPLANNTDLLFRTTVGGEPISNSPFETLTSGLPNSSIDVSEFSTIRVAGNNRSLSTTDVTYFLVMTLGSEFFVSLDTIVLAPGEEFSRSYDVPGIGLGIKVDPSAGVDDDAVVDAGVWGFPP